MLMADDGSMSGFPLTEGFAFNNTGEEAAEGYGDDDLSIEIGALFDILEEDNPDDSNERQQEDLSYVHSTQGSTPYNDGPLPGSSSGDSECAQRPIVSENGILNTQLQLGSPGYGNFCLDKDTVAQTDPTSSLHDDIEMRHEMDNGNENFSFSVGCLNNYAAANSGSSNMDQYHNSELQFTHSNAKYSSENQLKNEDELKVSMAAPRSEGYSGMEVDLVDDRLAGYGDQFYGPSCGVDIADFPYSSASAPLDSFSFDLNFLDDDHKMSSTREENVVHLSHGENPKSMITMKMDIDDLGGQLPMSEEYLAAGRLRDPYYSQDYPSVSNVYSTYNDNVDYLVKKEMGVNKKEMCAPLDDNAVMMTMRSFGEAAGLSSFGSLTSNSSRKSDVLALEEMYAVPDSKRPRLNFDGYDGNRLPMARSLVLDHPRDARDTKPIGIPVSSTVMHCTNFNRANGPDASNSDEQNYDTGDDADLCVLEDISGPAQLKFSKGNHSSSVATQPTMVHNSLSSIPHGHSKPKANRERHIFRAALQDLCQQLTEESPPEGFMAVPLLKHQRLALSWMIRKETAVSCPGGILADDQGLGKTISTISLILKERSPSSAESSRKPNEPETLDLDDEDDDNKSAVNVPKLNQGEEPQGNGISSGRSTSARTNRRIAAGTLIVCPTSVIRQWSDELHNKVTKKANLSVLMYHGSHRTKDPYELAKYDVVLTTYAIVSMEVPKKPLVDDDEDDTKGTNDSQMEFSSSKNRKYPPNKKSSKSKKSMEVDMQNIRPLAAVGWFRVVLDEAQSIKNHRTQVARACWGLRAKRRWCLSGTPMQNTVDDLYSYFRFLKFDPYSSYKSFCSEIKNLIQRSPSTGFRKLQAVLKTVMLRRTKGTFLDGEPIINLPPKTIKLHKVEFSPEERDFYQTLEADSRAQFAEYAAAGTVQKNYVNILLMLLRLRQACDHPLLVKGFSLDSKSISSVEMVKKIPRETQLHLLQLYDASGSICTICKDPPEDAVITSCGHIFCNQCICEHLSGDDSHCPAANCKRHLKGGAVFSVAALKCSLLDTSSTESTSGCSQQKVEGISEHPGSAYDSSKIKAALEVLQSLKPHGDARTSSAEKETLSKSVANGDSKGKDEISRGSPGEKAIVFSQWTRMLDLLEDCLKKSSIQYRRLDGTMSVVARDRAVKDFNTLPEVSVMIMSLKAASLGLNMVAACHVLMLDLWWNPTTEDQAIDRAHRIGQTRPVTVLRLTVKDTVEDRILALQQKKREMVSSAFGEDEAGTRDSRLTVEDLNYLFS